MAETNEITTVLISEEQFTNKTNCVICFVKFAHNESVKKLQCNHMYHIKCIDTWLTTKRSCPICRFNVLPEEEDGNTDAEMSWLPSLLSSSAELSSSISSMRETFNRTIELLNNIIVTVNSIAFEVTNSNETQMHNGTNQGGGGAIRRSNRLRQQRPQAYSVEARTNTSADTRLSRITRSMSRRLNQNDQPN